MTALLRILGTVLLLGGMAHTGGVMRLYLTAGVPDPNRVLLDVWIAEAHLLGGALYLAGARARRSGEPWRALASLGSLTMIGFAAPMLPVLIARAPLQFWIPNIIYLAASIGILAGAIAGGRPPHADRGDSKPDSRNYTAARPVEASNDERRE